MRNLKSDLVAFIGLIFFTACNDQNSAYKNLSTSEFEKAISSEKVQLVDVRTKDEYNEKRIADAKLIDVNDAGFEKQMKLLSKDKPVYIYCLSGGRSATAAAWASTNGFKEVYNLDGGIMAWTRDKKPIETSFGSNIQSGLTFDNYLKQVKNTKLVLVDFNAVWCGPCKVLKPIVQRVIKKNESKAVLLDIDVDKNPVVANTMNVRSIPLLILYKDGKEVWRQLGVVGEDVLQEKIDEFSK